MIDVIPSPKKNVILDATLLSLLMSCPRLLDLKHTRAFTATKGKSNSLEAGSLVHKVLEVYYAHMIKGFKRDTSIGLGITAGMLYINGCPHCSDITVDNPICKHEAGEYPGVQMPEDNDKHILGWKWVMKTCEQYFDFYKNDAWIPLFVETVKGKILYEDDEIRILWKAKFDLGIDTNQIGICSVDHKTFKQRRDKTSLSNQFLGQCCILESRNVIVNKIGFQTTLDVKERFTREVVSYSKDRLDEWKDEILPYYAYKYIQFSETEYWPPNFTHCDNIYGACEFKDVCQSNRNMRQEVLRNDFTIGRRWDVTNRTGDE
jgi:hypothetical protein